MWTKEQKLRATYDGAASEARTYLRASMRVARSALLHAQREFADEVGGARRIVLSRIRIARNKHRAFSKFC